MCGQPQNRLDISETLYVYLTTLAVTETVSRMSGWQWAVNWSRHGSGCGWSLGSVPAIAWSDWVKHGKLSFVTVGVVAEI